MRKDFGVNPWLYPMPVLIVAAYDEAGVPNAMNAAWGGIHTDDMIGICLSEGHKTTKNILARRAFTVSVGTMNRMTECDYVGIVSGNKEPEKFAKAGFTARKSAFVDAPLIEELPMALECELVSYDAETNHMVGRIVNVSIDESVLGDDGKVDADLLRPIIYDPCRLEYRVIGEKAGKAFSEGKKLA
ncbi:MAG: flavin reductase family protein [Mailhella sp.]|nr:flavin reductase family protein [Mailhella sp.]